MWLIIKKEIKHLNRENQVIHYLGYSLFTNCLFDATKNKLDY